MNWVDTIIILIIIYTMAKGIRLGFILSIFNIVQVILSIVITKRYYPFVHGYIINNPKVYTIFKSIVNFILKTLFYSKNKENVNFIPNLMSKGLLNIVINLFAIILVFCLANILMDFFLGAFSFLLKAPILKQLNKVGGIVFGLIEGLFIVYLIGMIIFPIASVFSEGFIGSSILDSLFYFYLKDLNLVLNLFSIKSFI